MDKSRGFTIVELLIVIVVIAILASIVIVSYTGIQVRAENVKTTTAVGVYARALLSYGQLNGSYPTATWDCLADSNTTCGLVSGTGAPCFGVGGASTSTTFDMQIKTLISPLPQVSDQEMTCSTGKYQGGFFNSPDATHLNMYILYRGNQTCPNVSGLTSWYRTQQDDATFCTYQFPAL
jgi:prepilin-type N-terminal cleavage/methylation domain-containing protein